MGVPAFFAWLVQKYPWIMRKVIENKEEEASAPNPNGIEFDNLYLDMNGIIHPCCHPEDRPPPATEEEMYAAVFEMLDRLFNVVRPRKLLYMAIDGVAPRAKMNQQRARRFRSAQERDEKAAAMEKLREELRREGQDVPPPKEASWDHNVITPGTVFMDRLSEYLRYYIHNRINNDPAWQGVSVILSDATVPGEGEHKLVKYIRMLRASPSYDVNTSHVIAGEDADLIFLGMAMHETRFFILRDQKFMAKGQCWHCGKTDHKTDECTNAAPEHSFELLDISVARQCLRNTFRFLEESELKHPYNFENVLDDFVFMCFWVGNDFLPHLPSLDIREGGLDMLMELYCVCLNRLPSYLTTKGKPNLPAVKQFLKTFSLLEDEIMERRAVKEKRMEVRKGDKICNDFQRGRCNRGDSCGFKHGDYCPADKQADAMKEKLRAQLVEFKKRKEAAEMELSRLTSRERKLVHELADEMGLAHESRGSGADRSLWVSKDADPEELPAAPGPKVSEVTDSKVVLQSFMTRVKAQIEENDAKVYEKKNDGLTLGQGKDWRANYYKLKFDRYPQPANGRSVKEDAAVAYVEGLCWVFRYYFDGCASWDWFYPYHYAPFAGELAEYCPESFSFEKGSPFPPIAQLMSVLPAASDHCLPIPCRWYMNNPKSPIIDLYPTDFELDPNGIPAKRKWQWVILLPFSDQTRILQTLKKIEPELTSEEKRRNSAGIELMFVYSQSKVAKSMGKRLRSFVRDLGRNEFEPGEPQGSVSKMLRAKSSGLSGTVTMPVAEWVRSIGHTGVNPSDLGYELLATDKPTFGAKVLNPDPDPTKFPDIPHSEVMVLSYQLPLDTPHICALLPGASPHPTTVVVGLDELDAQKRDHRPKASLFDLQAARRFVAGHLGSQLNNRGGQPFILSSPPAVHRDARMSLPPPLPENPYMRSYGHSFAPGQLSRQAAILDGAPGAAPPFFTPYSGPASFAPVGPYTAALRPGQPPNRFAHLAPSQPFQRIVVPPPPSQSMQRIVVPPPPPREDGGNAKRQRL